MGPFESRYSLSYVLVATVPLCEGTETTTPSLLFLPLHSSVLPFHLAFDPSFFFLSLLLLTRSHPPRSLLPSLRAFLFPNC